MTVIPEDTLSKLNSVLTGILERPQLPATPLATRLDQAKKELEQIKH